MGWAEFKVKQYHHGLNASWLERRMLEHANPVHFFLAIGSIIALAYGLWTHELSWVLLSIFAAVMGHVYTWTWKPWSKPD